MKFLYLTPIALVFNLCAAQNNSQLESKEDFIKAITRNTGGKHKEIITEHVNEVKDDDFQGFKTVALILINSRRSDYQITEIIERLAQINASHYQLLTNFINNHLPKKFDDPKFFKSVSVADFTESIFEATREDKPTLTHEILEKIAADLREQSPDSPEGPGAYPGAY